jgi:UDP-N-acetylglucosamine 2-epimerase (non-hydrolysing)
MPGGSVPVRVAAGDRPRVLIVVGTRPEGIKLAPVLRALDLRAAEVDARLALTGQHTDLLDQVLDVFRLRPHWDLGIMREGQDLYDIAHGCLDGLRGLMREWSPDLVLVEGDTATVFLAGLVAFFERTRVGHVEAGLRSRDRWRPWPEEVFRRLTGVVADLHFAPTPAAGRNLADEGIERVDGGMEDAEVPASRRTRRVYVTGNTVVDAVRWAAQTSATRKPGNADLRRVLASGKRLVLLTAHRRESFGEPLRQALRAVRTLADEHEDAVFLYPVHPNPNVQSAVAESLAGHDRVVLTRPLDYIDLVIALRAAVLVVTDSGGIQEEATALGRRTLVLREVTERPEAVEAGVATLVGTDPERIRGQGRAALSATPATARELPASTPYGDGRAGERIADIVIHALTGAARRTADWSGFRKDAQVASARKP